MARTIYVEFAVSIPDDAEVSEVLANTKVSITGESIFGSWLSMVCDDDKPVISNFLK